MADDRARALLSPEPMNHLQAVLLDVDGTLIDSNDKHTECWIEAFAHFGKKVEWETIRQQIGKGGDLLVPDTLNAREMRQFGEPLKEYRGELWKRRFMRDVKPFPGVRDAIETFRSRQLLVALASSSNPDEVEYYVDLLGVEDLIGGTTSKEDAQFSKPSPEIFQAALDELESDPARTLAVGDTPYDVLAAHRIPVAVAAVLTGGFPAESLRKAEFLFEDLREMVKELDRIDDYFREWSEQSSTGS
jgi:HAD superfamily hydrolase (TIGR01509 family)